MIYSRSPGWQSPQEQKNVSPAPYPWRKLYSCKNKTFLGPTFPFPWSSGLSSLAALGRQLSCRSRKVKSCPSESLVPPWFHSFIGNLSGIYILPPSPKRGKSIRMSLGSLLFRKSVLQAKYQPSGPICSQSGMVCLRGTHTGRIVTLKARV